jgi:hypothetical protein
MLIASSLKLSKVKGKSKDNSHEFDLIVGPLAYPCKQNGYRVPPLPQEIVSDKYFIRKTTKLTVERVLSHRG